MAARAIRPDAYAFLRVDVDAGVARVTFNQPEVGNRWSRDEERELHTIVTDAAKDDKVRALILTGAGETFSGGAHHYDDPFTPFEYYERYRQLFEAYMSLDKPVVVALNGPAMGAGLTLALLGDVVIAERHVEFRDLHVVAGAVSATGSLLWPISVGLMQAKRYLLTGTALAADEALRLGLITEVVERGCAVARAEEYAAQIAALAPAGVQGTKRALNQWLRIGLGPVFQHALALEMMTMPAAELGLGAPAPATPGDAR